MIIGDSKAYISYDSLWRMTDINWGAWNLFRLGEPSLFPFRFCKEPTDA